MSESKEPRIDTANIVITAKNRKLAQRYADEVKQNFSGQSFSVALLGKLKADFEYLITLGNDENEAYESQSDWLQDNDEEAWW